MTLIYQRPPAQGVQGAMHALIVGVGGYPFAKPGLGTNPSLRQVRDLPSAADSAKLMCDWLLSRHNDIVPKLGSLEVLISEPAAGGAYAPGRRYTPISPELGVPIEEPDGASISAAGSAWLERLMADQESTAFFYACGHGANYGNNPVLFLSDLNAAKGGGAWSHLNIGSMARALCQVQEIMGGVVLLDACGEFVKNFPAGVNDAAFILQDLPKPTDQNKVTVLCAASAGQLAYPAAGDPLDFEGADAQQVNFGRFTQTILKSLNGSSARAVGPDWIVTDFSLVSDVSDIYRTYFSNWPVRPFAPLPFATSTVRIPIIKHEKPALPIVVVTDPQSKAANYNLAISLTESGCEPWLGSRKPAAQPWLLHLPADGGRPFYAHALDPQGKCHTSFFQLSQPIFEQRVPVS